MKKYMIAKEYAKLHHKQAGMTLIELTVVLLILIGLAGLMIPYVAGFVEKTHDSTTLTNITTLDNAIPQFRLVKNSYPDKMESLVDTTSGTIYSKLFNTTLLTASGVGTEGALSLTRAGISSVYPNDNTTTDATFKSTLNAAGTVKTTEASITSASNLAFVASAFGGLANHMAYSFGGTTAKYDTTCHAYVAFGIGQDSDLIGSTVQTAPVHFSANGDSNPADKYSRYLAVFQIQTATGTSATCPDSIQPAKFLGTAMNMDFGALIGAPSSQAWTASRSK